MRLVQTFTRTATEALAALTDAATRGAHSTMVSAADTIAGLSDTATRALQAVRRTSSDPLGALTDSVNAMVMVLATAVALLRDGKIAAFVRDGKVVAKIRNGIAKFMERG